MKTVLKYPGAKNRIAKWIVNFIPEHDVYLEPFAGSLAVFFNKPRCHIETINDLHGEVVNYFKMLRDNPDSLIDCIQLTPYSREEYDNSYIHNDTDSDVERARKFCVRCWQGFGCANLYHNGFKSGQQTVSPNPSKAWNKLPNTLKLASERLKGVQIECLDALELIRRYNTEDVFIYCDPPYVLSARKSYLYKYEMTDKQHVELLELLKQHKGKVLISGYNNDLYNSILVGWHKEYKDTTAEQGLKRTECLWMNYEMQMILNLGD